jgi:hypothetical protein
VISSVGLTEVSSLISVGAPFGALSFFNCSFSLVFFSQVVNFHHFLNHGILLLDLPPAPSQ